MVTLSLWGHLWGVQGLQEFQTSLHLEEPQNEIEEMVRD